MGITSPPLIFMIVYVLIFLVSFLQDQPQKIKQNLKNKQQWRSGNVTINYMYNINIKL